MNEQRHHPIWCSPLLCNAYPSQPHDREYHRSEPLMLPTESPRSAFFVHRGASPDGSGEYIEIAELEIPFAGPFYDEEPASGFWINLSLPRADALARSIVARLELRPVPAGSMAG